MVPCAWGSDTKTRETQPLRQSRLGASAEHPIRGARTEATLVFTWGERGAEAPAPCMPTVGRGLEMPASSGICGCSARPQRWQVPGRGCLGPCRLGSDSAGGKGPAEGRPCGSCAGSEGLQGSSCALAHRDPLAKPVPPLRLSCLVCEVQVRNPKGSGGSDRLIPATLSTQRLGVGSAYKARLDYSPEHV